MTAATEKRAKSFWGGFSLLPWALIAAAVCVLLVVSCSTAKKKTPELAKLEGKKVALVEVEGEPSARSMIEVALVNQLTQKGTFELIPRQDVQAARTDASIDPTDWRAVARKAGADYALRAVVLRFSAETQEGYSKEIVEDSQMAAERGKDDAKTERLYKVKRLDGDVAVELQFTELSVNDTRVATAEAKKQAEADERLAAAHLPPKMRFLEALANDAFRSFFETYQ